MRWSRETGAWIDVEGTRTAIPMSFPGAKAMAGTLEMSPVPYFPGREGLLRFTGMERVTDQEGLFVHPLAEGAEAYYRYETGDTISYSLPDGRTIRIVEVTVRAREPAFDLILGSLWFDLATSQVVRAAYKPAAPFDIKKFVEEEEGEEEFDDVPRVMKPLIFPMVATVEAFTVEYGLHQGRWWLPRVQSVNGRMQVGVMRSPFEVLETFSYSSVNGSERMPKIVFDTLAPKPKTEVQINIGTGGKKDRVSNGFGDCAPGDTLTRTEMRYNESVPVAIRIPCDTVALASSPALPPSISILGRAVRRHRAARAGEGARLEADAGVVTARDRLQLPGARDAAVQPRRGTVGWWRARAGARRRDVVARRRSHRRGRPRA